MCVWSVFQWISAVSAGPRDGAFHAPCQRLFLATTIGYIDRQVVATLEPVLKVELGWDQVTYGRIVGAFQLAYLFVLLLIHLLLPKLERMELDSAAA